MWMCMLSVDCSATVHHYHTYCTISKQGFEFSKWSTGKIVGKFNQDDAQWTFVFGYSYLQLSNVD